MPLPAIYYAAVIGAPVVGRLITAPGLQRAFMQSAATMGSSVDTLGTVFSIATRATRNWFRDDPVHASGTGAIPAAIAAPS